MESQRDWMRAIEKTWIVRFPKQHLATFGTTNVAYYVVTEPIYQHLNSGRQEGVIRTGRVIAEQPAIVTPYYAMNLKGFSSEAYEYLRYMSQTFGSNSAGVLYQYRNQADNTEIVTGYPDEIANRIGDDLDERKDDLAVVMVGVDEYWDVALLKFIYQFTSSSAGKNMQEFKSRGLLEPNPVYGGVPRAATQEVERMFRDAENGSGNSDILKLELDRWGLFDYYQDRFLSLFRG
ncbi:MAG: hypothetical protein O3A33_03215 [Chloroflexi bacterium]|nr:hypothetical protein [Chloroflexota bacterium]